MSANPKSAPPSHPEPARSGSQYRLAIVGAGTLQGKELAEVLTDRSFPSIDIKLLDDDESLGKLEGVGEEVTFIQSVRNGQFEKVDFTFFAGDEDSTRKNWQTVRRADSDIVDLSYALEDEPGATVRSPWIERQLGQAIVPQLQPGPVVIAHPASVVLALLSLRLQKAGSMMHQVATVFQPASEHGQKGMDELHEQTVNLLSFQQLPKKVFDVQVAFNMVRQYGEHAAPALASVQERVLKHYRRIVGHGTRIPSLLLVQAPIFHGHTFAIHVEFAQGTSIEQIEQALAGEHVHLTAVGEDTPTNVSAAGQGDVQVSVSGDESQPNSFWLWAASDNLRVAAVTAVECAETMAASRPRGKIQ